MAEVNFNLTGNNQDLVKNMEELRKAINNVSEATTQLQPKMEALFDGIKSGAKETAKIVENEVDQTTKKMQRISDPVLREFLRRQEQIKNDATLSDEDKVKRLSELSIESIRKESVFGQLLGDVSDYGLDEMRSILARAEKVLAAVKAEDKKTATGSEYGITEEAYNEMIAKPEKIEEAEKNIKGFKKQVKGLDSAYSQIREGFSNIFKKGADPKKFEEGLAKIEKGLNKLMESAKFLSDTFSGLGETFGNDTLKGIANGINIAMDTAKTTMAGAKAGMTIAGPWGAAAGAAVGLVSSLTIALTKLHDAKHEKKIAEITKEIKELEKSYKDLEKDVSKSYSSNAVGLIDEENANLEKQKVLIQNQIAEEKSKKKVDKDRIKGWEDSIKEINERIAENKEKQINALFGNDVKNAINDFAQAYANAWAAGNDRAKSSKEFVKNMIKQMIMESLKMASSQPMEELRKKLAGYFSDGVITGWEQDQIEKDAKAIMDQLDSKFSWADKYMVDEKESSREASTRGIATASQDSVNENNGILTGMQEHTYNIKEGVRDNGICLANMDKTMTSMMTLQGTAVSHLSNIENHTARLATIEQAMFSIKTGIDTLNTNGLTLKR